MAATVTRDPATRTQTCPACGVSETWDVFMGAGFLTEECQCGMKMHHACYWGRIASLDEWLAFARWLEDSGDGNWDVPTICAACRRMKVTT